MNASQCSPVFQPTRWSLIQQAAEKTDASSLRALEAFCRIYWPPLYCFARKRGLQPENARDATQDFFTSLLQQSLLSQADPERGKLRTYLLTAFGRSLVDRARAENAAKRGGGTCVFSIDAALAEGNWREEPADLATPEQIFDRRWALTVLSEAMKRLEEESGQEGDSGQFRELAPYLSGEAEHGALPRLAEKLNVPYGSLRNRLSRLRLRYRELLRREIAETLPAAREECIDDELRILLSVLSG